MTKLRLNYPYSKTSIKQPKNQNSMVIVFPQGAEMVVEQDTGTHTIDLSGLTFTLPTTMVSYADFQRMYHTLADGGEISENDTAMVNLQLKDFDLGIIGTYPLEKAQRLCAQSTNDLARLTMKDNSVCLEVHSDLVKASSVEKIDLKPVNKRINEGYLKDQIKHLAQILNRGHSVTCLITCELNPHSVHTDVVQLGPTVDGQGFILYHFHRIMGLPKCITDLIKKETHTSTIDFNNINFLAVCDEAKRPLVQNNGPILLGLEYSSEQGSKHEFTVELPIVQNLRDQLIAQLKEVGIQVSECYFNPLPKACITNNGQPMYTCVYHALHQCLNAPLSDVEPLSTQKRALLTITEVWIRYMSHQIIMGLSNDHGLQTEFFADKKELFIDQFNLLKERINEAMTKDFEPVTNKLSDLDLWKSAQADTPQTKRP